MLSTHRQPWFSGFTYIVWVMGSSVFVFRQEMENLYG
jgi:hypothetical protein